MGHLGTEELLLLPHDDTAEFEHSAFLPSTSRSCFHGGLEAEP
jgi:hypothetical protein